MNFLKRKALTMFVLAFLCSSAGMVASQAQDEPMTLSDLFPDFQNKVKDVVDSSIELARTIVAGSWKILQPHLHELGAYIKDAKGGFTADAINMHMGNVARNTNIDIAKSIAAKATAGFVLYDLCCLAQKAREKRYDVCSTRGWLAWAFSDYDNQCRRREAYVCSTTKWALRAALIASLIA